MLAPKDYKTVRHAHNGKCHQFVPNVKCRKKCTVCAESRWGQHIATLFFYCVTAKRSKVRRMLQHCPTLAKFWKTRTIAAGKTKSYTWQDRLFAFSFSSVFVSKLMPAFPFSFSILVTCPIKVQIATNQSMPKLHLPLCTQSNFTSSSLDVMQGAVLCNF